MSRLNPRDLLPEEWGRICVRIEELWPGTKTYRDADRLYKEFQPYDPDIMTRAVADLFGEGRQTAPAPSMLLAAAKKVAGEWGSDYRPGGPKGAPCRHSVAFGHWRGEVWCATCGVQMSSGCGCDACRHSLGDREAS